MNPILGLLGGMTNKNSMMSIMLQAVMAAKRGESAESFLQSLSKTDSRFSGFDFNNVEQTAHEICQQKGVDEGVAVQQVKDKVESLL